MSYEPTNWKTGDVVTSAKLNKLENGVADAGGVLLVNAVDHEDITKLVLDQTYNTIREAILAGKVVIIRDIKSPGTAYETDTIYSLQYVQSSNEEYQVVTMNDIYVTHDPDGYPSKYYGD